ncbi:hypothetical protein KKC17_01985 [Patescibacteria group bacterium]|nr:hypothetical protein [Patescibacteria group bacterium]
MKTEQSLTFIKSLHTIIWLIMAVATIYILYAGLTKTFNIWLWISIGLLVMESIVLLINRWTCPLTPVAMKYTTDRQDNFDIYLPLIMAKYNKIIFGTIFAIGLLLVIFNTLTR